MFKIVENAKVVNIVEVVKVVNVVEVVQVLEWTGLRFRFGTAKHDGDTT